MSKMPKQVTMYRDDKTGRFVKGKPEAKTATKEMTDYLRDSAYADALVQESLGRVLDEKNAEIWDNERQVIPTTTILDWFMNNMLKASATLLFFVAALYLGVRV